MLASHPGSRHHLDVVTAKTVDALTVPGREVRSSFRLEIGTSEAGIGYIDLPADGTHAAVGVGSEGEIK
jgi:hypothetical protein